MSKLALYEPPFALDGEHIPTPIDFREQITNMVATDRRDEAVKLFMKVVGVPAFGIFFMRLLPNVWPKLRAVAHTLPYDFAVMGDTQTGAPLPAELRKLLVATDASTLVMAGGKSPEWMHYGCKKVAELVPHGTFSEVPSQDHNVAAKAVAPRLKAFFST